MRVTAIWREDLGVHRLYVTNALASMLELEQVPAVYALRWEIELGVDLSQLRRPRG